jgi:hypothetical protein
MKRNVLSFLVLISICGLFTPTHVQGQTMMPLPAHSSIYSGSARGYWFTAPTDFLITGLRVASTAGSGTQNIQVVKFSSAPNTGCCTGPTFTTEFFVFGAPNGVIQNTSILVTAGEFIGILGTAGTSNSYTASAAHTSTILGQPVNLYRMGLQANQTATPVSGTSLWGQLTNGNLSRVEMYYAPPSTAPNDAGITAIDSPAAFCDGPQNIVATVSNHGINQINGVTINWTFNGVLQTPVSHTGLLDTLGGTGSKTAQVVLGNKVFVANQTDEIVAWTSMPNGVVDTATKNDTAMASVQPALSGVFTIDPSGSGATNYLTFTDAIDDLNTYGICSPITFNVKDGVYAEQISIGDVDGTSATNTITFQADPTNTGPVELSYFGSSTDNYIIGFNGASYVTFDGINGTSTGSYSTVVRFEGSANHNTVKNGVFTGQAASSTSTNYAIVYANDGVGTSDNTIMNNELVNGSYGIYYRGASTSSLVPGVVVEGNTITDPYYYGMYFYYTEGAKVKDNVIESSSVYGSGRGINFYYGDNGFEITGNVIKSPGNWPLYGMYVYYCDGTATERNLLANNMVHVGESSSASLYYGLYVYYNTFTDVLYNNVAVEGTSTSGRAIYPYNGGNNTCYNNNFLNYGNGYAVYALSGYFDMDHNNLATAGANLGYYSATASDLTAWQGLGVGANSINVDSIFTNLDSLRTCSDSLYAKGKVVDVTVDVDGDPRSATAPNIGADEYIANAEDFTIGDTLNFCGGSSIEIGRRMNDATFTWSTGETTPTITVTTAGTYSVIIDGACATGMTDEVLVYDRNPIGDFNIEDGLFIRAFENTSVNGVSYLWDFGDGSTSTTENPWHQYAENGQYTVSLTIMNECDTIVITKVVSITVGINEISFNDGIMMYPNPAKEVLNIDLTELEHQTVQVQLFNLTGQLQLDHQLTGAGIRTIDITGLTKGIYLVKVTAEDRITTQQLVVQ